jgi:hypothetical protein
MNPFFTFQKIDQTFIAERHSRKPDANLLAIPPKAFGISGLCKTVAIEHCTYVSRRPGRERIPGKKAHSIWIVMKKFPYKI